MSAHKVAGKREEENTFLVPLKRVSFLHFPPLFVGSEREMGVKV